MHKLIAAILVLTALLAGCQPNNDSSAEPSADAASAAADHSAISSQDSDAGESWDVFVNGYIEASLEAHPAWAVYQGRHEFDGQLPDWSRAAIEAEIARVEQARQAAKKFTQATLSPRQQFQRDYFVARLDHDLFWMSAARWPFRNPIHYLGWMSDSLDPSPYLTLDYAPLAERMRAFTQYLEGIPEAAAQIRANLAMPMPETWLEFGIDAFDGYAVYFEDEVTEVWAGVDDPELHQAFGAANRQAVAAMRSLANWMKDNRDSATTDFALGPELYRQMLWDTERVDTPLDELEAIARADLKRNQQNLATACESFAPGDDIRSCFAKMAANKPEGGAVEAARRQLDELKAFLVQADLVSIPGSEEALVAEAPPYARSNFAYINIPGPWAENQPSVYNIAPPNPEWPPEVQAGYIPGEADLLATSIHEVWPGHFLNFLHANRASWIFGRAYVGYAFAEGWAHYTEELMLDAGLRSDDPETRIGQIANALLRNARFISSLGLHTQGWTVERARRFFIEQGFQDEGNAIQQAARGTYDPAYLNYNMGKLMIMRLRDDWTASRGGRQAWKAFHDEFLSYGGPPIPLVRKAMMDEDQPISAFPQMLQPADQE
ncbi:MAG: DUF885 domain-containing protein [Wenzhouxiangellaceae bacterium]|nr:DUF885 domain-containing protein [Wenzhouxiangellaceae bacterium]